MVPAPASGAWLPNATDAPSRLPSVPNRIPRTATHSWAAGQTGNGFSVEVMLDRAVSHAIHDQVMTAIDTKYGIAKEAHYHAVLNQAMHDLAAVYAFPRRR